MARMFPRVTILILVPDFPIALTAAVARGSALLGVTMAVSVGPVLPLFVRFVILALL